MDQQPDSQTEFDVLVVGAGFAGLYMLYRLRNMGLSVRVLEAGTGVGGTWFWNRYPGARCDIESMQYSYQFSEELQQEWEWTERYASQPEILAYIDHVADRFDLRGDVQLETTVESARFDEASNTWTLRTDAGEELRAPFCVLATGCLSKRNTPPFPGIESYRGETYHTGEWPHERVDFRGKRVGVIGTGSSAIQSIPQFAREAEQVTVFQRTAGFSVPAQNAPLDPEFVRQIKSDYAGFRKRNNEAFFGTLADFVSAGPSATDAGPEDRERAFEDAWQVGGAPPFLNTFDDMMVEKESNDTAVEFVSRKIRETVKDPEVAEQLIPDQTFGCKRLCIDTDYYETYNRPNVSLVSVADNPIAQLTPTGLRLEDGSEFEFDALVFATGFDAMTGSFLAIDPVGKGGTTLREQWSEGPKAFLGIAVSGIPNLFTMTGPGSPSVLANMVPAIEQNVNWIADCIAYVREHGYTRIEATQDAQEEWAAHVNEVAEATLFTSCNSWYLGSNIPGKPRVFMPYLGFAPYVDKCNEVAERGYEGFVLSS